MTPPNWRRVGRLIGKAVSSLRRDADRVDRSGTIESLKRVAQTRGLDYLWHEVENRLSIERRCGIWEGADCAKRIIRKEIEA